MKKILLPLVLLAVTFAGMAQSISENTIVLQWQTVMPGMETTTTSYPFFGAPQSVSVVRYDPSRFYSRVIEAKGENADHTSAIAEKHNAVAAINGSYFNMKILTPETFVKSDGQLLNSENRSEISNGLFLCNPDGTCNVAMSTTSTNESVARDWSDAIGSGPLLIESDREYRYSANPRENDIRISESRDRIFFNKRHNRTLIGTGHDGKVYMAVVDGRSAENASGMTIDELTHLSRILNLREALNLDGGGSSTIWVAGTGVLNHPSDNKCFDHAGERRVPNIVAVFPKL